MIESGILLTVDNFNSFFKFVNKTISVEPNCVHENPANSKYCNTCGKSILNPTKTIKELHCNFDIITKEGYLPVDVYENEIYRDKVFMLNKTFEFNTQTKHEIYKGHYKTNLLFIPFYTHNYINSTTEDKYINMWNDIKKLKLYLIEYFKQLNYNNIKIEAGVFEITTKYDYDCRD